MTKLPVVVHDQGGSNVPYEKYHLTKEEWNQARRVVDETSIGLAPAGIENQLVYVDVPKHPYSSGVDNQRAIDGDRLYIHKQGSWKIIELVD